jgi:hypothetical protein
MTSRIARRTFAAPRAKQRGVVLFIALIVLVAMTLAGIAAVRSVDTTNQIAGNLAFKQATAMGGEAAIESARTWLLTQTTNSLQADSPTNGYYSFAPTSGAGVEPDWTPGCGNATACFSSASTAGSTPPWRWTTPPAKDLYNGPDPNTGNYVYYVIQRMCNQTGDPNNVGSGITCYSSLSSGAGGPDKSSRGAGSQNLNGFAQYYYRVTVQVIGPRNTVSYIQAMVEI